MRSSFFLVTTLAALSAGTVYAACNLGNPSDPENDCDSDGCRRALDCNDSPDGGIFQHNIECTTATPAAQAVSRESCDGIDNNCNGSVDEPNPDLGTGGGCSVPGAQGLCVPGFRQCVSGAIRCVSTYVPVAETCDGADNDCDGDVDEQAGAGSPKLTQTCYTGPNGTANVGECRSSTRSCTAGSFPSTCAGEVLPTAEICDNKDQDCDGVRNNGNPGGGGTCNGGPGRCQAGTNTCNTAGNIVCVPDLGPIAEQCNGADDDCDGVTDEAPSGSPLTQACYTGTPASTNGVGPCRGGTQTCSAGAFGSCAGEIIPTAEVCDAIDNDCNGTNNNGNPGGGTACNVAGQNANSRCFAGTQQCAAGDTSPVCRATRSGITEVCNGFDDDCDGSTDEQSSPNQTQRVKQSCYTGPNGTNNVGICRGGQQACTLAAAGSYSTTNPSPTWTTCGDCSAVNTPNCTVQVVPENTTETKCDSRDENCAGGVDEPFMLGGACTGAGTGRCANGFFVCRADQTGNQCNLNTAIAETCNGVDDDCNGAVDNGNPGGGLACTVGGRQGVCAAGTTACSGGAITCNQNVMASLEVCDGLDNDCNGAVDDNVPTVGNNCNTGQQGVCEAGRLVCNGASNQITCQRITAPSAEVCDNLDNNCDGLTDNGAPARKCYTFATGSAGTCPGPNCFSVGECSVGTQACDGSGGFLACTGDRGPTAEVCDGRDNDCNGNNDNGLIIDADNDTSRACGTCNASPAGACDCDDNNANVRPGRLEVCNALDDNCNSQVDEGSGPTGKISRNCYSGAPNTQGRGTCVAGTQECNASTANVESYGVCIGEVIQTNDPALAEINCNAKDDDCDGVVDDGFDGDSDTFVSCAMCAAVLDAGIPCDCDDSNFTIKPGAPEFCDTVDQNCNGRLDDVPGRRCFSDAMGMNQSSTTYTGTCPGSMCTPNPVCTAGTQACSMSGAWGVCGNGALGNLVLPSAEVCDNLDNNCDGLVDNANFDVDNDGYKSCIACASAMPCDCNDNDPAIYPGAAEVCDNVDNNCDGTIDGANTACYSGPANTRNLGICRDGTQTCLNGVGQGVCAGEVTPTPLPGGGIPMYVDGGTPAMNDPEGNCNGIDDDCDGIVDDGFDLDGDGQTTCQGDCDDMNAFNRSGGFEVCDCQDNNCNATIDDGNVCYGAPCHDLDLDGFTNCQGDCDDTPGSGNAVGPNRSETVGDNVDNDCDGAVDEDTDEDGDGYSTGQGDCNDNQRDVFPAALERCDGFDNNCNNRIDEGFDNDNDTVSTCAGDCNDSNPAINPTLRETCGNLKDDNCDGRIDEDTDVDLDGVSTCQGDCNDFNAAVHAAFGPIAAAAEVCDGQDNNCSGLADEGFDADGDFVSRCFGDCDDTNVSINPYSVEVAANGKDDNCNGQTDEGTVDVDMDGFTGVCGDCNDADPGVNPHVKEVCDRIDNNCDGYVDSSKGVYNLCSVCFDADGDGQTNCDGDCNDADRAIYRGASELCDGKDNDCDGMLDLDPVSGLKVCRDAGVALDGGGMVADAGPGSVDAGPGVNPGGTDGGSGGPNVVTTGCGCNSSDGFAPLALAGLLLMAARRKGKAKWLRSAGSAAAASAVVAMFFVSSACNSSLQVPPGVDGGAGSDGGPFGPDGGPADAGVNPIPNWNCPGLEPVRHAEALLPTTIDTVMAYSANYVQTSVEAAGAVLLDDAARDIAFGVLVRDAETGSLEDIAAREIAGLEGLQGTPLVRAKTERFSKVYVDKRGAPNYSTSQDLNFSTATNAFAVRNRLLANFSNKLPSALGTLPAGDAASPDTGMNVAMFIRKTTTKVFIGFAVTPLTKLKANQSTMSDLSNGSHLSGVNGHVAYFCEPSTVPALKTDFILVLDNTPSTVTWRAALENASASLFAAFKNSGLDFRIGVVTTDSDVLRGAGFTNDLDQFKSALQVGLGGNVTEMGIEYGLRAILRSRMQTDANLKVRDGAGLVVLFMSDEDNHNTVPVSMLVDQYKAESAVAFSIVGPRPFGCTKIGYADAQVGSQYITLANQTGGSSGSICNENVTEVIEEIVIGALGASSRSDLDKRPVSGSIAVRSTGRQIARSRSDGFDYDPSTNSVLFFGASAPAVSSMYDAAYAYFEYIE